MTDYYDLLCLLSVPGLGPNRIARLIFHFENTSGVFQASQQDLMEVKGIDRKIAESIVSHGDPSFAQTQIDQAKQLNIRLISFWDSDYPESLKSIYDPPVLLYCKGNPDVFLKPGIAIVGTRRASSYGRSVAESFAKEISCLGIPVISGLAKGIDTCAHRGALKGNGKTVAVLGCGANVVYPAENRGLYQQISEEGAILSEFPIDEKPAPHYFPRRNRIVSGMSAGTVVVEAGKESGALITAYLALEQNREVFAVPGPVQAPGSKGPHRLIREGAKLVENVDDILNEITQLHSVQQSQQKVTPRPELNPLEEKIWDVLSDEPLHIDVISEKTDLQTSEALTSLLTMELKQAVRQLSGMMYVRQ